MMNNDPMMMLVQALRSGQNPMALLQSVAGQNPRVAQAMQMIRGKSPQQLRTMTENMARERGIDINDLARQLGIR